MPTLLRCVVALLPLAVTPILLQLIAEGRLDLGGGEKDLVVLFPWVLWSLLFAGSSFFLWYRGTPVMRASTWAALIGIAGLLAAAVLLASVGQLGVGGVF
jgi:hypothetical protein